jgi:rubrerythrin
VTHVDPSWCARINAHRRPADVPPARERTADAAASPEPSARAVHGSPFRLREVPKEHVCECCGTVMYDHNCKIVCPNCGYKRDCSDP